MLLQRIKIWAFTILTLAIGLTPMAWADNSHQITITIQESCRYRIENSIIKSDGQNEVIQEVAVAIISNSHREWRFVAIPEAVPDRVEWSVDGRNWQSFENGANTVLAGHKTPWNNYHIYYRYQPRQLGLAEPLAINYQIMYES